MLFLLGVLALTGLMNAQTTKGSWVVDGKTSLGFNNFSINASGNDSSKLSVFYITPSASYFVIDNLAIGVGLDYATIKVKDVKDYGFNDKDLNLSALSIVPSATYYFNSTNIKPYLGAGLGYGVVKLEDYSKNGLVWNVNGGLVYLINNNVGINAGLKYAQIRMKEDNVKVNFNNLSVAAGFSIFL